MLSLIELLQKKFEEKVPEEQRTYPAFVEFAKTWLAENRPVGVSQAAQRNLILVLADRTEVAIAPVGTPHATARVPRQPVPVPFGRNQEPSAMLDQPNVQRF